ncbi:hypothetical protein [Streptomyces sp. NPDC003717]
MRRLRVRLRPDGTGAASAPPSDPEDIAAYLAVLNAKDVHVHAV